MKLKNAVPSSQAPLKEYWYLVIRCFEWKNFPTVMFKLDCNLDNSSVLGQIIVGTHIVLTKSSYIRLYICYLRLSLVSRNKKNNNWMEWYTLIFLYKNKKKEITNCMNLLTKERNNACNLATRVQFQYPKFHCL